MQVCLFRCRDDAVGLPPNTELDRTFGHARAKVAPWGGDGNDASRVFGGRSRSQIEPNERPGSPQLVLDEPFAVTLVSAWMPARNMPRSPIERHARGRPYVSLGDARAQREARASAQH